jgi:hypothetical protein
MSVQRPILDKLCPYDTSSYHAFFDRIQPSQLSKFSSHSSLSDLVELAYKVVFLLDKINPICNSMVGSLDDPVYVRSKQWQLDRISEIKKGVAEAMEHKKTYYDSHWLGIITKCVLKCLGKWDNGNTASIRKAEDFLLRWDSRCPVSKIPQLPDYSEHEIFVWLLPTDSMRRVVNTSTFYNYTPSRIIPLKNGRTFQGVVAQNAL